jgi:uncharacterized OsmC-like protein
MTITETQTTDTQTTAAPQLVTPEVQARLVAGTATQVRIKAGEHAFTIDEPETLGGTNLGATPVDHLLAALGACQVITYQVWAEKLGIAVDTIDIDLRGDLDLRGFFGTTPGVRPGFQGIEVAVRLAGPESKDRYAELVAVVEEHCPVQDNLQATVPVTSTVTIA